LCVGAPGARVRERHLHRDQLAAGMPALLEPVAEHAIAGRIVVILADDGLQREIAWFAHLAMIAP
jgi:hypothetical protein